MKLGRIADVEAAAAIAALVDDDVFAVQKEEHMAAQAVEEVALIDRLIDEVDKELTAHERAEHVRLSRAFTDQRRARRAHRRAEREVLRTLPVRLDAPVIREVAGEAA